MLEVREITKTYDKLTALYGITFKIDEGDTLGVLGMAGSGKSTLMNILSGAVTSSSGTVLWGGRDISRSCNDYVKQLGYMPQKDPIYMDMSVNEYLAFCCSLKGIKRKDAAREKERVRRLAALDVDCSSLASELSVLNRKKLSLAQALVGDPSILLIDEPCSFLSGAEREEITSLIKKNSENKTMIYSSRSLFECTELCDNVIIINRGRIAVNNSLAALSAEISECTRIKLRVVASRAVARKMFTNIEEITDIELQSSDERGTVDVIITYPSSCDLRRRLWEYSETAGIPVIEMKQLNISLEDIYLQMSGER